MQRKPATVGRKTGRAYRKAHKREIVGRPTKFENRKVLNKLLRAIRLGNYYGPACAYAGVSYDAFREWIIRGEADEKTGIVGSPYAAFRHQVIDAELEAEARVVALWRAQVPQDWRAAKEFLRMRFRKRWKDEGFLGLPGLPGGGEGGTSIIIPIREVVVNLPGSVAREHGVEAPIPIDLPRLDEPDVP